MVNARLVLVASAAVIAATLPVQEVNALQQQQREAEDNTLDITLDDSVKHMLREEEEAAILLEVDEEDQAEDSLDKRRRGRNKGRLPKHKLALLKKKLAKKLENKPKDKKQANTLELDDEEAAIMLELLDEEDVEQDFIGIPNSLKNHIRRQQKNLGGSSKFGSRSSSSSSSSSSMGGGTIPEGISRATVTNSKDCDCGKETNGLAHGGMNKPSGHVGGSKPSPGGMNKPSVESKPSPVFRGPPAGFVLPKPARCTIC